MMRLCSRISLMLAMLAGSCLLLTACVAVRPQPITYNVTPGKEDASGDLPG